MSKIRPGEIYRMRGDVVGSLADIFVIGALTETPGTDAGIAKSYTDGDPQFGSVINPTASQIWYRNQASELDITKIDALLRSTSVPALGDRVTILARNGIAITPEVYYVSGPLERFRTIVVTPLRKVAP